MNGMERFLADFLAVLFVVFAVIYILSLIALFLGIWRPWLTA